MNSREPRKEEFANRLPPNQPLEWTPPCCALRRHSAARYVSKFNLIGYFIFAVADLGAGTVTGSQVPRPRPWTRLT